MIDFKPLDQQLGPQPGGQQGPDFADMLRPTPGNDRPSETAVLPALVVGGKLTVDAAIAISAVLVAGAGLAWSQLPQEDRDAVATGVQTFFSNVGEALDPRRLAGLPGAISNGARGLGDWIGGLGAGASEQWGRLQQGIGSILRANTENSPGEDTGRKPLPEHRPVQDGTIRPPRTEREWERWLGEPGRLNRATPDD